MNKQHPKFVSYLFPTFANILWLAAFYGVLFRGRRMMNADGDFALHLNLGRVILETGQIPLRDVFSHTMTGQPVMQHEWLTGVIYAFAERLMGFDGAILISALLIATTFWLVFKRVRAESQTLFTAVTVILIAMITSMVHWLARPHLFTFLLLTLWMLILQQLRKGKLRHWWLLPVLMLLWVNLHGGFIAGFMMWFIYGVGLALDTFWHRFSDNEELPSHFWRSYLLGGGAAFLVSLINPSGFGLWKGIIGHLGNRYLAAVTMEFQSPNFHEFSFWPFLIFIGLLVIVLGLNKKKVESANLLVAVAWLLLGLYSARNIPLFAIVAAPLLGAGLDELWVNTISRVKFLNFFQAIDFRVQTIDSQLKGYLWPVLGIVIAVVGLGLGFRFDSEGLGYAFDPEVFPVEAVNWLEDHPQDGEMFNYFTWGGYLQYRLWPEKQVFIDSKSDFYGEDFVRQYGQVVLLEEGWEGVIEQYQVDWAILPPTEPSAQALQFELGWDIVYEDNTAVILRRK